MSQNFSQAMDTRSENLVYHAQAVTRMSICFLASMHISTDMFYCETNKQTQLWLRVSLNISMINKCALNYERLMVMLL